jgi:hypothetical protein
MALCFYLDFFIKSVFMSFLGLLITLNGAPVFDFVVAAFFLSLFHLLCLFLGWLSVCLLEQVGPQLTGRPRLVVTLGFANLFFVVSLAAIGGWGGTPADAFSEFSGHLVIASILAITNFIPVMIAAACGRIFKHRESPQC